ncbi:MAG: hypothetical protein PS018_11435 [bacterium]|nr:hypothetical protein [bacterium]
MDPITGLLLGGGSTLASMFLNSAANNSVNEARNGVISAERGRQAGFDAEGKAITDKSLGRYANYDQTLANTGNQLSDYFRTNVATPNTPFTQAPLPPAASDLVQREIGHRGDIAHMFVDNQADKLGKLRAFGTSFGGIGRDVAGDTQDVGQIGNFKKGSSSVEQLELDNANRAGNDYKFFADLTGGLGKVALTSSLAGQFAPAAATTGVLGAPMNILPPIAQTGPTPLANVFSTGAAPFLRYG